MSQTEIVDIKTREFDYSQIDQTMADLKKSFWKVNYSKNCLTQLQRKLANTQLKFGRPGHSEEQVVANELIKQGGFMRTFGLVSPPGEKARNKKELVREMRRENGFNQGTERSKNQKKEEDPDDSEDFVIFNKTQLSRQPS